MFSSVLRFLRRLHRPAGLGLAALLVTVIIGGLYDWEITRGNGGTLLLSGEYAFRNFLNSNGRTTPLRDDIIFLGYDKTSMQLDGLWPEELETSPALKTISQTQGAWPWPRAVQAMILERLARAGAKAVVFDLVFEGPSPDDALLRAALDRYRDRVVIGANYDFTSQLVVPTAALIPGANGLDDRVGYVDFRTEPDGKIHSLSYRSGFGDPEQKGTPIYESLVARTLRKLGRGDLVPPACVNEFYNFRYASGDRPRSALEIVHAVFRPEIPRDDGIGYKIHPVYEIFVKDLWQKNYHAGADFKDKVVLVGPVAAIMHDVHDTPFGALPGPQIHLHALTAALNHDFLFVTSPLQDLLLIAAMAMTAWLTGVFVHPPLRRAIALILLGLAYVFLVFFVYNRSGLQWIALTPLLTLYLSGFGGIVGEYIIERAEKSRVRGVLDRLVSKDIVRELLEDRERYAALVRGERRAVTVLFSDVRGFTSLSESADDPAAFVAHLNEYLAEMVDVVFKHRGTLDKFIGDAVMAVWGSMHTEGPEADAAQAVAAALEMHDRLAALNARWQQQGKLPLEVGIGLNHGEGIVGGLGSEHSKLEIAVMGDAVNLASRLEGLTKEYGLRLLVGESVARLVSSRFRLRTVDLVRVKGKKQPAEVMTVLGPLSDVPTEARELLLADYEDGILLYRRQEFAAAASRFESCLKTDPTDHLAALYLERCHALLATAPAADWDGVRLMTTK